MSSTLSSGLDGGDKPLVLSRLQRRARFVRHPALSVSRRWRSRLAGSLRLTTARLGDYPSVQHLLQKVLHGPSAAEFQAQLEDPTYSPRDRLLVKDADRVVAHLRLSWRQIRLDGAAVPVVLISDVVTDPQYRGRGCATALLAAAEERMIEAGAVLGLLRTSIPRFYGQRGWTICGRRCFSVARPREILAHLSATRAAPSRIARYLAAHPLNGRARQRKLRIRPWRQMERAALVRLYDENTAGIWGAVVRSESYWRWLVGRHSFDQIYVAIEGPDRLELDDQLAPIVGYAVMKGDRIVELMASPRRPDAPRALLARACADAIEGTDDEVRFDGPPDGPLHRLIRAAGGRYFYEEALGGQVCMVRMPDPFGFLELLSDQLLERARAARLPHRWHLGLLVEDEKCQLVRRGAQLHLVEGKLGRNFLSCSRHQLVQLLLGHLQLEQAAAAGHLECSSCRALTTAAALFPLQPFWRSPLDELPA